VHIDLSAFQEAGAVKGKKNRFRMKTNWRAAFLFENGDAEMVNYEDYHYGITYVDAQPS